MRLTYEHSSNERIDKFLSKQDLENLYSRSQIEKLINKGFIKVNDKKIKKNHKLESGDQIEINIPKPEVQKIVAQDIPIQFLFEDDFLVIANKPAGIAVHPAPGHPQNTLVNAMMHHLAGKLSSGSHQLRPGIVHRLDLDTTGAIIIAKDDKTHSLLSQMFQNREVKKTYRALIVREPKEHSGTIKTFIDRSKTDRKKMAVSNTGKKAISHYEILEYFDLYSYVEIILETGRTHQIRVHFSHINCPILGDETYSSLKRTLSSLPIHYHKKLKHLLANHLQRQALHAYNLKFIHPITKDEIDVTAPLPEDMKYTLAWLRKNYADIISI